jgi:hypothetical protein
MSKKKFFKRLIQMPLKFHHQDLHDVLDNQTNVQLLILREIQEVNIKLTKLEERLKKDDV